MEAISTGPDIVLLSSHWVLFLLNEHVECPSRFPVNVVFSQEYIFLLTFGFWSLSSQSAMVLNY